MSTGVSDTGVSDTICFTGIPEKGDMDRVASYCKDRGVTLNGVSWRA